jgi:hypothetical protein
MTHQTPDLHRGRRLGKLAATRPHRRRQREVRLADHQFCRVAREGRVLIVTHNRPEVMNALHRPAH